jgi:hypothetical protein
MENRAVNETPTGDEILKKLYVNQRTIIEQTAKIIRAQERREVEERRLQNTTAAPKVPSFVKVSWFKVFMALVKQK